MPRGGPARLHPMHRSPTGFGAAKRKPDRRPSKLPPLERVLRALAPADRAAVRLGGAPELRMLIRVHRRKRNEQEVWARVPPGEWARVGRWTRGRIPAELMALAKDRGWDRAVATTEGDAETVDAAFERKAHRAPPPSANGA